MNNIAFDSEKYLNLQRDHILERISQFDGKLYMEFGGKMLEDFHAARVLPGYEPDNKIKLQIAKDFILKSCEGKSRKDKRKSLSNNYLILANFITKYLFK